MDIQEQNCVMSALKIIGRKWTIPILHQLTDGPKRFGQLQKVLIGISPKTLSQRLKQLEKDCLIKKKIFAEIPLHVEYSLTTRGQSLKAIISKIRDFGETSPNRFSVQ